MLEAHFRLARPGFFLDAKFKAPATGVTGIFGPSGSGKTTLLRLIAGLERPEKGWLSFEGRTWQDDGRFLKPHLRPIGYVFQDARLFAHLDVMGNLDFASRRARTRDAPLDQDELVSLLGLEPLLRRKVGALSGGERQRVAIGRALLSHPRLLLMDEPLASLDRAGKREILPYLERVARRLSIPVLYVSHDLGEIERFADHLVLLERGEVLAFGPLAELAADPRLPLARDPDAAVVLDTEIESYDEDYRLTACRIGTHQVFLPGQLGENGEKRPLRVRAGDVSITLSRAENTSILNILPCRIAALEPAGEGQVIAVLTLDGIGTRLLARVTARSQRALGLMPGLPVHAQIKGMALVDPHR
jgi:molybdate transport system ATP-binding protein